MTIQSSRNLAQRSLNGRSQSFENPATLKNQRGLTPLMRSLLEGANEDRIQQLFEQGARVTRKQPQTGKLALERDVFGQSALDYAALSGSAGPLMDRLIKRTGGILSAQQELELRGLAERQQETIQRLSSLTQDGRKACFLGVTTDDCEEIAALIQAGLDVQKTVDAHVTPLAHLAQTGCTEAAKLLIQAGADLTVKNAKGQTPLVQAALGGHHETAEALRKGGAKLEELDAYEEGHQCPTAWVNNLFRDLLAQKPEVKDLPQAESNHMLKAFAQIHRTPVGDRLADFLAYKLTRLKLESATSAKATGI